MKNRIRLILSFTIPYVVFIAILGIILVSIFIPINRDFYFNKVSVDVNTVKKDVEGKVDDIVNSLSFLSSYAELGINTPNIATTITNVRQFGNYFDVFYCNTVPYSRGGTFISSRITYPANYDQTTREWYVNASKSSLDLYMTEPYLDFTTDKLVITFINKIKINNRLAGYFGIDFDNMNMLISEKNNESINVVTKEGLYITHDEEDYILNNDRLLFSDELFSSYRNNMDNNNIYIKGKYWYTVAKINNAPWYISVKGDASFYYSSIRYLILFLIGFGILFVFGELIIVSISIIPLSDRLDDVITCLENMSTGDFTLRIKESKMNSTVTKKLSGVLEKMQRNLGKTMYRIKMGVEEVNKNGEAIANVSVELSNKANEQSNALSNLVSAINSISSSIEYESKKTDDAKSMSDESFENTKVGVKMINEIENNMNEITESSNKISHIIETIQSIASQTNILALNAAVEAARAGDQGRGFAVVATEVRSLAQTVTNSADNITQIVEGAVSKIEHGSEFVSKSSEVLTSIESSSLESSNSLSEVYRMSNDKKSGINNINNIVAKINDITKSNTKFANESAESSVKASKIVNDIVEELSFFKFKAKE
ncbi:methyl-accepting chemotaxis protein [uncultured Brachyspira sp.]|uniref:methyl-accepting chemotaxis protein n=1 Tax=uncultured Brachyspira sp. TaxID=221953 RepID=UPI00261F979F|nr:methyl-accepting chemotaxis protein [uncultured Brachyspira sp.]